MAETHCTQFPKELTTTTTKIFKSYQTVKDILENVDIKKEK